MARNKNSTALFDVIHAAKKPPKASPSANMPTPRWWGKDKKLEKKIVPPTPASSTENVGKQKSWLSAAKKSAVVQPASAVIAPTVQTEDTGMPAVELYEASASAPIESIIDPTAEVKPKTRFIDRFVTRPQPGAEVSGDTAETISEPVVAESVIAAPVIAAPAAEPATDWTDSEFVQATPVAKSAAKSSVDYEPAFKVDPGRKEFLFRLSYGGLIAIGFIFLLALGIAFIAGKRTAIETADADSQPTTRGSGSGSSTGMLVAVGTVKSESDVVASNNVLDIDPHHPIKPAITLGNPPAPVAPPLPIKKTRDIGMIYVVIQSYAEQDLAQKACDFVNQAGVPCTLVQGPAEWAPHDWYSVVGLQPFNKHDTTLPDYERNVKSIGVKFSSKPINQFDPHGYTWRQDSDLGQP